MTAVSIKNKQNSKIDGIKRPRVKKTIKLASGIENSVKK
jgi:hypothetical protein